MPAVFLDRLPLPNLQAYTGISIALLSCSFYYAIQVTSTEEWKLNSTLNLGLVSEDSEHLQGNQSGALDVPLDTLILDYPLIMRALEIINFMVQEPLCIWTLINMAYCCLILIGKVIQKLVFGDLRVSEQQHIKDKFWNFVFYKFIFIFGVMNVQFMDEVLLWCSWFSVLGFLHLLAQLSKDRFEYLSFSPTTPKLTHVRLLALLSGIMLVSSSLFIICVVVGLNAGINTFAFMAAECSLVTVRTLYVIVRYAIHLWDISHEGVWEHRATYVYYTELFFELVALATDFLHHLHMLLWGNIFLSMASLVICMQLRYLFYEIQRRVNKHKNYLRVIRHMESNYTMATAEELDENSDDCAICWDRMEAARKLPCGHLFHNSCLRSWLEQDTSCPTCRMTLNGAGGEGQANVQGMGQGPNRPAEFLAALGHQDPGPQLHPANQTTNHFFHFDGSRYVSWLPSFSVEVTHTTILGERQLPAQSSQLDTMARQVHQMFPHMPINTITDDLRITRSVDLTVENILDERLVPPPVNPMFHNTHLTPGPESRPQESNESPDDPANRETNKVVSGTSLQTSQVEEEESSLLRNDPQLMLVLGSRFSKSPKEREDMLSQRKEELLKVARKKYLSRKEFDESSTEQS